jgi:hypothetical protein
VPWPKGSSLAVLALLLLLAEIHGDLQQPEVVVLPPMDDLADDLGLGGCSG